MEQNFISRHIDCFAGPNNQTVNPVDRAAALNRQTQTPQSSLWNPSALGSDPTASMSPTTPQNSSSFTPFQAGSGAPSNFSFSPPLGQRPIFGQGLNDSSLSNSGLSNALPTRRPSKSRGERHERKRSKLSTDATPFDSVDYWLQFDNEEGLQEETQERTEVSCIKPENSGSMRAPAAAAARRAQGQGVPSGSRPEEAIDDSALDNALSDEEENYSSINLAEQLSKIDSVAPSEVPQREGLYSTPLSWERPQPGLRMDSIMSIQSQTTLDLAEQRRLIAIAMNPGSSMGGLGSNIVNQYSANMGPALGSGFGTTTMSQLMNAPMQPVRPTPTHPPQPQRQGSMAEKGKEKAVKSGDRTAHNDIERKYRTNLKDKIAELRDSVPALRTIPENAIDDGEDGGQPSRGPKVSKGTVLTKATEYIHYLEKKNKMIVQKHQELSRRLQAFEQLLNAAARPTYQMPNYSRTLFDPRAFC